MNLQVFSFLQVSFSVLFRSLRCFSSSRMFFSAEDNYGDASTAGDGASIYMSALPQVEELLVKRNDAARLSLLIFLQNKQTTQLMENKKSAVSHLGVSRSRVNHLRLPNGFSNQDFGRTFTLIFFIFPLNFNSTSTLNLFHSFSNFDSTFTLAFSQLS